ncbi:MAG TPA: pyridoxamine 5'-phosphate oxidase family protein [Terrimicrobiaceae bacterium]
MNPFPDTDVNSLDPKNREQIINMARRLLKADNPGILCTVDQSGFPQSRWMATMSFDDFPDLYTLTAANSRKVGQIREHPIVHWMFSNNNLSFVVNLTGRAEIYLRDAETMKRIWKQITDKSRAFFLDDPVEGAGFAVIHTKVEAIECTLPRKVLRILIDPAEMSSGPSVAKA